MKDTIKNSIIGAFAIFGLVALISSSNTAPTIIQDGTPESHVWEFASNENPNNRYLYNKVTGEVRFLTGEFVGKQGYYWVLSEKN
jgi:hypothetical protein